MKYKIEIKEKEDNSEMNSWFLLQLIVLAIQQRKEWNKNQIEVLVAEAKEEKQCELGMKLSQKHT